MPKSISELDANFAKPDEHGVAHWEDVHQLACEITGLHPGTFCRLPLDLLPCLPQPVQELAYHTAGGMIRFTAKAGRYGYRYELLNGEDMHHMPRTGSSGLDVYWGDGCDMHFLRSTQPGHGETNVSGEFTLDHDATVTMYLPLYNGIRQLWLGFDDGNAPMLPPPRRYKNSIVFYGSSITQGGCASRPANSYAAMVCRMLDAPQHVLGFSGNGKGEIEIAQYIAELPMTAFVMDYDHNAPDAEHLKRTHLPFLKAILAKQPNLPILMLSKPDFRNGHEDENAARRDVVIHSYEQLRAQGVNCAFIDGETFFDGPFYDSCTVDGCHPNDLGFYRMAMKIEPQLRKLLG